MEPSVITVSHEQKCLCWEGHFATGQNTLHWQYTRWPKWCYLVNVSFTRRVNRRKKNTFFLKRRRNTRTSENNWFEQSIFLTIIFVFFFLTQNWSCFSGGIYIFPVNVTNYTSVLRDVLLETVIGRMYLRSYLNLNFYIQLVAYS